MLQPPSCWTGKSRELPPLNRTAGLASVNQTAGGGRAEFESVARLDEHRRDTQVAGHGQIADADAAAGAGPAGKGPAGLRRGVQGHWREAEIGMAAGAGTVDEAVGAGHAAIAGDGNRQGVNALYESGAYGLRLAHGHGAGGAVAAAGPAPGAEVPAGCG